MVYVPENEHADPEEAGPSAGGLAPFVVDTSSTVAVAPGMMPFTMPAASFVTVVAMDDAAALLVMMADSDLVTTWKSASRVALLFAWLSDRPAA